MSGVDGRSAFHFVPPEHTFPPYRGGFNGDFSIHRSHVNVLLKQNIYVFELVGTTTCHKKIR